MLSPGHGSLSARSAQPACAFVQPWSDIATLPLGSAMCFLPTGFFLGDVTFADTLNKKVLNLVLLKLVGNRHVDNFLAL